MGRKDARTTAMHGIYQMDIHGYYQEEQMVKTVDNSGLNKSDANFAIAIGQKFLQNIHHVDEIIENHLKDDWKIDRISKVELAILRIAVTEMLYVDDVPDSVAINEAVELAKQYSDEGSSSFINGLLGAWLRESANDNDFRS